MKATRVFRDKLTKYVSLRYAPSFRQAEPHEVIGVPTRDIPKDCVSAFILPDVVTVDEEKALLQFCDPWFSRLPYNDGHMDALIHHFKEFYRSYNALMDMTSPQANPVGEVNENKKSDDSAAAPGVVRAVLERCRGLAATYLPNIPIDDRVHFLRLSGDGFIRAHVDENRNSTGIIAGLNLGSGRVMTLTHPKHPGERVELLLAPRAFYVMIGTARYDWEHSTDWVKDDDEHIRRVKKSLVVRDTPLVFDGKEISLKRGDRTAIIFRGVSPMELLLSKMQKKQARD